MNHAVQQRQLLKAQSMLCREAIRALAQRQRADRQAAEQVVTVPGQGGAVLTFTRPR